MEKLEKLAMQADAIGNESRIAILEFISEHPDCGQADIQKQFEMAQPNCHFAMKRLKESGFVSATKLGKLVQYKVNNQEIVEFCNGIAELVGANAIA